MKPLTKEGARELALRVASKRWGCPIEIQDELTKEFESGWVFFYNSSEFVRTRRAGVALFGNAPLIVGHDGRVSWTGTAHDIDAYLEAYRALGPDRFDAGESESFLRNRGEPG